MPFLKRLGFYLAGLSVGLVFVAIFLKKKSEGTGVEFCYLPNCRVLKELRSKPLSYSDIVSGTMTSRHLDSSDIRNFLEEGDVDFKNSDSRAEPCSVYRIGGAVKGHPATLEVRNCETGVIAERLHLIPGD